MVWDVKKSGLERPYRFTNLEKLFKDVGELGKGKDLKIIVGMTFPSLGHAVSIFCRRDDGVLKAFVYDASRGLTFPDSSSHEVVNAIRHYAQRHHLRYKIIINSTTLEKDHHTCTVFSLQSCRYFMKYGAELFPLIDNPEKHFFYTKAFEKGAGNNVVFLKADHLPEPLLKWGQYETLDEYIRFHLLKIERMRKVYGIEAKEVAIVKGIQFDSKDIFATEEGNERQQSIIS